MADYSTYADLLDEIPIFTAQGKLDQDNIEAWIPKIDKLIDAALASKYSVPFDKGTSTPPVINQISILKVAAKAIRYIYYSEDPDDPRSARADDLDEQAEDLIKSILSDEEGSKKILTTAGVEISQKSSVGVPSSNTEDTDKAFPLSDDVYDYDFKVDPSTGTTSTTTGDGKYL